MNRTMSRCSSGTLKRERILSMRLRSYILLVDPDSHRYGKLYDSRSSWNVLTLLQ